MKVEAVSAWYRTGQAQAAMQELLLFYLALAVVIFYFVWREHK